MNWWKDLRGKIRFNEPLKNKTTFRIGGSAKFFIEPKDIDDLKHLLSSVKRYKIPTFVIGAGSNVLVSDKGIQGIVFRLNAPYFKKILKYGSHIYAGSGSLLNQFILKAAEFGLSGVEFLAGIPGTVGGALCMNAGVGKKNIGDLVEKVTVMDYNGNIKVLGRDDIRFEYRKSSLGKFIILSADFKLAKKDKKEIKNNITNYLKYRRDTQDSSLSNAGCVFKNPPGNSAGRLIDLCGLKGRGSGSAYVSLRHANFILNRKNALAGDVLRLMSLIKKRVKRKFKVNLEPEIKIWR